MGLPCTPAPLSQIDTLPAHSPQYRKPVGAKGKHFAPARAPHQPSSLDRGMGSGLSHASSLAKPQGELWGLNLVFPLLQPALSCQGRPLKDTDSPLG